MKDPCFSGVWRKLRANAGWLIWEMRDKHCIRYAGPEAVHHVHTQADVHKLGKVIDNIRLVLLYASRLRNPASWVIQTSGLALEGRLAQPTLFCDTGLGDAGEDPGVTLVLRGDGPEQLAVAQWLLTAENDRPNWSANPPDVSIQAEPALGAALLAIGPPTAGLGGLRNGDVLQALLAGATITRSLRDVPVGTPLATSMEDYELVRRLLQSRVVAGTDEAYNPLAADMVRRANVFLAVKYGGGSGNPFSDGVLAEGNAPRPPRELVTRREVSDLGNIRSRMVRRLVEFLQRQPDGHECFRRMGLVRRPPDRNAWRQADVNALIACLRPWTYKQVRTHFDLLRRAGMLTADREQSNGPWRYELPEELTNRPTAFEGLPSVQEITARAQAS